MLPFDLKVPLTEVRSRRPHLEETDSVGKVGDEAQYVEFREVSTMTLHQRTLVRTRFIDYLIYFPSTEFSFVKGRGSGSEFK